MPDYLDQLIASSTDRQFPVRPRVPALFEPVPPGTGPSSDFVQEERSSARTGVEDTAAAPRFAPILPAPTPQDATGATSSTQRGSETPQRGAPTRQAAHPDREQPPRQREVGNLAKRIAALEAQIGRVAQRPGQTQPSLAAPPSQGPSTVEPRTPAREPVVPAPGTPVLDHLPPETPRRERGEASAEAGTPPVRQMPQPVPARMEALELALASLRSAPPSPSLGAPSVAPLAPARGEETPAQQPTQIAPSLPAAITAPLPQLPAPQTLVQVSIGRVEVKATAEVARPRPERTGVVAPTGLDEYLRHRNGGGL